MPRDEYNTTYDTHVDRKIGQSIAVSVLSKNAVAGSKTTMLGVGNAFIMVPTGGRGPSYDAKEAEEYAQRLAGLLVSIGAFSSARLSPPQSEAQGDGHVLSITFNKTYMGGDGWPTELDATFQLSQSGIVVFEKRYEASSGISGGCWDCFPDDIAEKKMTKQFFADLKAWAEKQI